MTDFAKETKATREPYGLDRPATRAFGALCLAARKLGEKGVRFVRIFHGGKVAAAIHFCHPTAKGSPPCCASSATPPAPATA